MDRIHFILTTAATGKEARNKALLALSLKNAVPFYRGVPAKHKAAYVHDSTGFHQCIFSARLMQAASLLNANTMLNGIFGPDTSAEHFERLYATNPQEYKAALTRAFTFMGACVADWMLDQRQPRATPGEDWTRGDFDLDGLLGGMAEVGDLKKLMANEYFQNSYFLDADADSAAIPSDIELQKRHEAAGAQGAHLMVVPVALRTP